MRERIPEERVEASNLRRKVNNAGDEAARTLCVRGVPETLDVWPI
jgi:hypothetical protein